MLEPVGGDGLEEAAALHLVEEVNHRVINEYADVICTLSLAAMHTADNDAREQLTAAANRVKAFAQGHRALLPPDDPSPMDLGQYVGGICEQMFEASLKQRGVSIALRTEDLCVSPRRCWRIGLVIAELIRNSCKHGFSGGSGNIVVGIGQLNSELWCTVRDDGSATINVGNSGRGRRLVELLALELGGSIRWEFRIDGCSATLRVPTAAHITRSQANAPNPS